MGLFCRIIEVTPLLWSGDVKAKTLPSPQPETSSQTVLVAPLPCSGRHSLESNYKKLTWHGLLVSILLLYPWLTWCPTNGQDQRASACQRQKCVYLFFPFNFIKASIFVNQKQRMTFWPANFLTDAFVKWNFLCFLFLCCLLVLLARVPIILGTSVVLFIQRL